MRARLSKVTAAVLGCAALLMTAACTQSDGTGPAPEPSSPAASPESTSTLSAAEAEAAEAALAAYRAYRDYVTEAMITGKHDREEMRKFIGEPELGIQIHDLSNLSADGVTFRGRPKSSLEVVDVDLEAQPPIVVIDECYDLTDFIPYHQGEPIPWDGETRSVVKMKVKEVNGVWYVSESIGPEGQTC